MKNILSTVLALLGTLAANAQQTGNSYLVNSKESPKVHPETLMLNTLNNTQGTYIVQTGNYNQVAVESPQMQVNQAGDYQHLYYTETSKLESSNMNVNMEGANNYIEVYGNNSIMENMSINVQGNDRSVIIRNY